MERIGAVSILAHDLTRIVDAKSQCPAIRSSVWFGEQGEVSVVVDQAIIEGFRYSCLAHDLAAVIYSMQLGIAKISLGARSVDGGKSTSVIQQTVKNPRRG